MNNTTVNCLVCDGLVAVPDDTEVSEVLHCGECATGLVVDSVNEEQVIVSKAPDVEEDWGE